MDAFARHIARDGSGVGLTANLINLVDEDDAALGALDVHVGGLEEAENDGFNVVADVAGFGERGGVCDGERHVEHARERLGEERLAGASWANQEDVALVEFDLAEGVGLVAARGLREAIVEALVVIMDGDGEDLLGVVLTDDVDIEFRAEGRGGNELDGRRYILGRAGLHERTRRRASAGLTLAGALTVDEAPTGGNADVADADTFRASNELTSLSGGLAAEGATLRLVASHED